MSLARARLLVFLIAGMAVVPLAQDPGRRWLAGDSHIHSHWSPDYDRRQNPPTLLKGADAMYSTPINAQMAHKFGLSWMVTTDHGGPNHSKFNLEQAYPELKASREQVPEVLQFYGMELNMPAMDHHTLIIPRTTDEADAVFQVESRFDSSEVWPRDASRNTETAALAALAHLRGLATLPLMFANHPSISAKGLGIYGLDEPREFRNNYDAAPDVYRGMEGGPGHQASALSPDGSLRRSADGLPAGARGSYNTPGAHTLGGFDQMTAVVGGLWDALLSEGRRFWTVASSDSHVNFTETARVGLDFWPGQFHKTYVLARKSYDDVLDGLRHGRIFAVAGDLVTELDVEASAVRTRAGPGESLRVPSGTRVMVTIRFRDPTLPNANGGNPSVARVDLIAGDITGPAADRTVGTNPTARVVRRFDHTQWTVTGERREMSFSMPPARKSGYVRVRGTNTNDLEPAMDTVGENPWLDLWFYSNPVFIEVR